MLKLVQKISGLGLLGLVSGMSMNVYAHGGTPPKHNLYLAKQHTENARFHIQSLIYRCGGQGGGRDERPDYPRRRGGGGTRISSETESVGLDNDNLANLALQIMGREIFELGEKIDLAIANYGTPTGDSYIYQSCKKASKLLKGNAGAKVSAALPIMGFVQPSDFDANDVELQAVQDQLWCY